MWKIQYRNKCNWYKWKYRNNWKYKNMKLCRDRLWLRIIRLWRDKSLWHQSPRNSLSRFRKRATTRANVAAATLPWRTSISNPRRSCASARTASVKSISRRTGKHQKSDLIVRKRSYSVGEVDLEKNRKTSEKCFNRARTLVQRRWSRSREEQENIGKVIQTSISNLPRSCANARIASVKLISRRTGKHRKSDLNFLLRVLKHVFVTYVEKKKMCGVWFDFVLSKVVWISVFDTKQKLHEIFFSRINMCFIREFLEKETFRVTIAVTGNIFVK